MRWRIEQMWRELVDLLRPVAHSGRIDEVAAYDAIYGTAAERKAHLSVRRLAS